MQEYAKRLAEVDEIIKYLPDQYRKRIPKELMEMIKQNKDNSYNWTFNNKKKLYQQDIPRDTIAILSYINMEYFLDDEQKEFMKKCHFLNEKSIHTSENIFKNVFIDFSSAKLHTSCCLWRSPNQWNSIENPCCCSNS